MWTKQLYLSSRPSLPPRKERCAVYAWIHSLTIRQHDVYTQPSTQQQSDTSSKTWAVVGGTRRCHSGIDLDEQFMVKWTAVKNSHEGSLPSRMNLVIWEGNAGNEPLRSSKCVGWDDATSNLKGLNGGTKSPMITIVQSEGFVLAIHLSWCLWLCPASTIQSSWVGNWTTAKVFGPKPQAYGRMD